MTINPQQAWPKSWQLLEHGIRSGRYTDAEFCKLEYEKLWSNVWQVAARVDEIPEPGDYTVYDIGHQSVIVVRSEDNSIKAFNNACPHRGTALALDAGTFEKCRIICPFHGWRWGLDGANQYILEQHQFRDGKLSKEDAGLQEMNLEIFAGFVFINFSKNPQLFSEFIQPMATLMEDLAIGEMRHYWWKSVVVPANWKVAIEAFLETYHVPATHPQLETDSSSFIYGDDVSGGAPHYAHLDHFYETYSNGHGRFLGGKKTPMAGHTRTGGNPVDAMADRLNLLAEGMDAMILAEDIKLVRSLRDKTIPEGSTLGAEYVKLIYATAAQQKRPMPNPQPHVTEMWGGELFIFPNVVVMPQAGNALMYRSRPNGFDPDSCIFEIFSSKTYPADQVSPRARVDKMDDTSDPNQYLEIPRQDFSNIPRMQKGLRTQGCKQIWMAEQYEMLIMNLHRELDRYLLK